MPKTYYNINGIFSLIIEQILAFALSPNMVRDVMELYYKQEYGQLLLQLAHC